MEAPDIRNPRATDPEVTRSLVQATIDFIATKCAGNPALALAVAAMVAKSFVRVGNNPAASRDVAVEIIDDIVSGRAFGGGGHGDIDLPRLVALAEAATPGPWRTHMACDTYIISDTHDVAAISGNYDNDFKHMEADAAYIAAADPTTILALIGQLEVMEQKAVGIAMRLVLAERVVEAARGIFERGTIGSVVDISNALSAQDVAQVARNEGERT